ncbi:MAG: ISAs1 family transposase, partial [Muribaculaceae bacterium]|nr:ISAs1 family transposase [Muribaculaceae bacterium]
LLDCGDNSPSPDTFERVMSAVSPDELERCLVCHGRSFLDSLKEKQVAIDGKKLRGTSPKSRGTKGDYILNAYASENHIMIGQVPLTDKENEITAIPRLLDKLDIEGAVVSIDAIGTQTEIAGQILDKKADYFLAVKDNQAGLDSEVIDRFRYYKPFDESSEMEADHGRVEMRRCRVLHADDMEDGQVRGRWPGLTTLVEITSEVTEGKGPTVTTVRHYISSEDFPHASYYAMLARGQWGIENQLHWHLDVTFKEDASRARKGYAPQNLSMIRKIALQAVKAHPDKRSVRKRLFLASLDDDYLMEMAQNVKF